MIFWRMFIPHVNTKKAPDLSRAFSSRLVFSHAGHYSTLTTYQTHLGHSQPNVPAVSKA